MNHSVDLDPEAQQTLERLSPQPKREVNQVLRRLRSGRDPRIDIQLTGFDRTWRARAGRRWRVIFEVLPDRRIQVKRISRRRDAYEGLEHPGWQDVREPQAGYEGSQQEERARAICVPLLTAGEECS